MSSVKSAVRWSVVAFSASGIAASLLAISEPSSGDAVNAATSNPAVLRPVSAFEEIEDNKLRAIALFEEAGKVIQSPRCMNCHPATDRPTQTDNLRPHQPPVLRGTARRATTRTFTKDGFVPVSAPRALRTDEIPAVIASYRHAARCAMEAGFDGVEVHGANGYLLDQFLRESINDRKDEYGGSIANRARFLLEVMEAVTREIGGSRTGLRLSPVTPANDAGPDSDPEALYEHAVGQLAPLQLAFVEVVEGQTGGARDFAPFDYGALRRKFHGPWIVNNGYQRHMALEAVASGVADLVSFGRPFISNPDLVRRLREDAPLNAVDTATLFGGGAKGYTDYPMLGEVATA